MCEIHSKVRICVPVYFYTSFPPKIWCQRKRILYFYVIFSFTFATHDGSTIQNHKMMMHHLGNLIFRCSPIRGDLVKSLNRFREFPKLLTDFVTTLSLTTSRKKHLRKDFLSNPHWTACLWFSFKSRKKESKDSCCFIFYMYPFHLLHIFFWDH